MPSKTILGPDKRRITVTYTEPCDFTRDVRAALVDILGCFEEIEAFPAYVIIDVSALKTATFGDLVTALREIGMSDEGAQHTAFETITIYVGTNKLTPIAVEALKQELYGGYEDIIMMDTLDEAHAYIDGQLEEEPV